MSDTKRHQVASFLGLLTHSWSVAASLFLKRDPPIMLSKSLHQKTTDLHQAGYSRLGLFLLEHEVKKVAFVRPLLYLKQISANLPNNNNCMEIQIC